MTIVVDRETPWGNRKCLLNCDCNRCGQPVHYLLFLLISAVLDELTAVSVRYLGLGGLELAAREFGNFFLEARSWSIIIRVFFVAHFSVLDTLFCISVLALVTIGALLIKVPVGCQPASEWLDGKFFLSDWFLTFVFRAWRRDSSITFLAKRSNLSSLIFIIFQQKKPNQSPILLRKSGWAISEFMTMFWKQTYQRVGRLITAQVCVNSLKKASRC